MVSPASAPAVVVVGGGPAGLASAIALRGHGLEVTVVDKRRPPLDAACGEGIMPDGVVALEALGVDLEGTRARPFHGIRFVDGDLHPQGLFPHRPGLGLRRTELHDALVRHAEAVGVELRWGVEVNAIVDDGVATERGPMAADLVVAADGRGSRLRHRAGLDRPPGRRRRFGVRRHFRVAPWTDLVEVHWSDHAEAYVTPVADDEVGVVLMGAGGDLHFDRLLASFPALTRHLAGAAPVTPARGAGPFDQHCTTVVSGRLALVGDASACLDAISGEGLSLAFHQAICLAAAVAGGDLGAYVEEHRTIVRHPRRLTALLLLLTEHPRLRRRVLASLTADGSRLDRFLALKTHRGAPPLLGREGLAGLVIETLLGSLAA